ncbi:MAG TPA: IS66 family insertion sequence element accessory protein TnpB [Clostridia bacterium]|nr:IS66 family insertion sequence element accessory protein TnpB [Clostridia bacterium]
MEKRLKTISQNQRLNEWSIRVAGCRNSGQSVRQWCEENGINEKTYYYWQRKVFEAAIQREPCFAEIPMASARGVVAGTLRVREVEADIYSGADEATIVAIVRILKSC